MAVLDFISIFFNRFPDLGDPSKLCLGVIQTSGTIKSKFAAVSHGQFLDNFADFS
jgi:hypothetical protein